MIGEPLQHAVSSHSNIRIVSVTTAAFHDRWHVGLRAALSVGIPLLAGVAAGRPSWGAVASMGGFAGFYAPNAPYRYRLRLVAGIGLVLTVVVPLGSLCAPVAVLSVVLTGAVAGAASYACLAPIVPPPREYLIILAALAATGLPSGPVAALRECALVALGALGGLAAAMAPRLAGAAGIVRSKPC